VRCADITRTTVSMPEPVVSLFRRFLVEARHLGTGLAHWQAPVIV
jgi:hypothetical protein